VRGVPLQCAIDVTSSRALPAFFTSTVSLFTEPTETVPKSSEAGSSAMTGTAVDVADPPRARLMVGFAGSLLAIWRQAPAGNEPATIGAKVTLRLVLRPAGTENALAGVQVTEPGVPEQAETRVTFSVEPPVFCTCAVSIFEAPALTVPKAREPGLRAMAGPDGGGGGVAPVPLRARLMVGFAGSLLAMVRQAPAGSVPADVGAKVTLRLVLPEAGTENALDGVQVIEAGVPAQADTEVTFSVEPPVFCTCVVSIFEAPTFTVPNASEVGLEAMPGGPGGGGGGVAPVPLRVRLMVGFAGSLLAMVTHAPAGSAPAAVGEKVRLRVELPAAATVKGAGGVEEIEAGVPAHGEMPVTLSGPVPVSCTWVVRVFELPTFTVPNASEVGLSAIAGTCGADTVKAGSATVCVPWPELFASGVKKPALSVDEFPDPKDAPEMSYWLPYQATAQT